MIKPKQGSFAASCYEAGRAQGRKETIELCIKSILLWLYLKDCDPEIIQEAAKGLNEAIINNGDTPGIVDEAIAEMEENTGIKVVIK